MSFYKMLRENIAALLESVGGSILSAIPLILVIVFITLPKFQQKIIDYKKKNVQTAVEATYNILNFYHAKEKKGELNSEMAQKAAIQIIKELRYQEKEYFWINDQTPKMIMHPMKPELDGKDLSSTTDPTGKKLFVEMVAITKKIRSWFCGLHVAQTQSGSAKS